MPGSADMIRFPQTLSDIPAADDPGRRIEEAALRDWVWAAIGGLSEPLHDVVVLRYFSMAASYDAIAAALGIPVGTVRSRLHDARAALGSRLRELELSAADDHTPVTQARERLFAAIVEEYNSGNGPRPAEQHARRRKRDSPRPPATKLIVGRAAITRGLAEDLEAGVRLRLLRVVAGAGLTVVEGAF